MSRDDVEDAGAAVPADRTDDPRAAASQDRAAASPDDAPASPDRAAASPDGTSDTGSAATGAPTDATDDGELVERAAQGEVGAFAVLVHRHAAELHARAGDMDAVRRAFQRAMRRLDRADTADVVSWLAGLLPRAHRGGDASPGGAPLLPDREIDALWAELAPRWPRGRRPLRFPRWVRRVALVLFLLALAVTVPYLVLITAGGQDPPPEPVAEVEGVPLDDDAFDLTFEDAPDAPDAPDDDTDDDTDDDAAASGRLESAP